MNEHKSIPNIRFRGFEVNWREKKLNTLVNRKSHITRSNSLCSIEYENISPYNHEILKKFNNKKGIYFQKGDILFGKLRPYLKKYVLAAYEGKAVGDFWVLAPKKDINSQFVFYLIQTYKFYLVSNLSSGTKMPRSDWNLVNNSFFSVCNIKEQQKIGEFFTKLDKLLYLQQQKIDKLELLKKALLQKLFPNHDAKIPELRFKGFEDEWKKEKLSKLGHTFSGLSGKTKKDFGHGKAKYITYMNVFKNPLTSKTGLDNIEVDSKQHNVKYGDVLFTMSSETPEEVGMSSVWKYHLENIYLNSFSFGYRLSTKFDLNFLAFMFRSQLVRKEIKILAQGISRYNISKNKMMDIVAYFPTDSEQQKIGNLLSKVDQLIELENKKLHNLQQVKKCLLQNMFVE